MAHLFRGYPMSAEEMERMAVKMKTKYGDTRRRDIGFPHACECGSAIHIGTSHDPETMGKLYFMCFNDLVDGPGRGCGFRRWWIEAVCDEFAGIIDEKNAMEEELDKLRNCVVKLMDKFEALERKYEVLEKQCESLNNYP